MDKNNKAAKKEVKLNYQPSMTDIKNMVAIASAIIKELSMTSELIYIDYAFDTDKEKNITHLKCLVRLKENKYIEDFQNVNDEFVEFVEDIVGRHGDHNWVQWQHCHRIFNLWKKE